MVRRKLFAGLGFGLSILTWSNDVWADNVSLTPVVDTTAAETSDAEDSKKTVEQLLDEARQLFILKQPIDARSKLLRALAVAPEDYRPHMMLGAYYLGEVASFQLAYRYLRTAEMLFEKRWGNEQDQLDLASPRANREFPYSQHARLLFLLSEAQLNLDQYQDSLKTLDRYAKLYSEDWYPGSRAWVLMKLKRVDEAIKVAQNGIMEGAEPTRTYNILGILLSLKNNREQSLRAFSSAINSELLLGSANQVATPLNNAGEVYNELFQDRLAEAAFVQAIQLPDGCEHILPSLNLTILTTNELRLFQSERILSDFEVCFSQHSQKNDTEHRALLALARGRIALHEGDVNGAMKSLAQAADRQQWFGKIGTDPEDLKFAATMTLAGGLEAKANAIRRSIYPSLGAKARAYFSIPLLEARAWWLRRRAREIALDELGDLEDLSLRNTDAMLEYPTFGRGLRDFSTAAFETRINELLKSDDRAGAKPYYKLYLATNYLAHGRSSDAEKLLREAREEFRPFERLARAETLARLIEARENTLPYFFSPTRAEQDEIMKLKEELFQILPAHLRLNGFRLPIGEVTKETPSTPDSIQSDLSAAFEIVTPELKNQARFRVLASSNPGPDNLEYVSLSLWDQSLNQAVLNVSGKVGKTGSRLADIEQQFVEKVFRHRIDPAAEALPRLEIFDSALDR